MPAGGGSPDVIEIHLGDLMELDTTIVVVAPAHGDEWEAARRLLSKEADGVLFVVDSTPGREEANRAAFAEMIEIFGPTHLGLWPLPGCMLYHKRDLVDAVDIRVLDELLNSEVWLGFETSVSDGANKFIEAIKILFKTVLRYSLSGS